MCNPAVRAIRGALVATLGAVVLVGPVPACSLVNAYDEQQLAKGQLGQPCREHRNCVSGWCVDGVCCESECAGACQCCGFGTPGRCSACPAGSDPHDRCEAWELCNGTEGGNACEEMQLAARGFAHEGSGKGGPVGIVAGMHEGAPAVAIAGSFAGSLAMSGQKCSPMSPEDGDSDVYLATFAATGLDPTYCEAFGAGDAGGGGEGQHATDLASSAKGELVVAGRYERDLQFGESLVLPTADQPAAFVAHLPTEPAGAGGGGPAPEDWWVKALIASEATTDPPAIAVDQSPESGLVVVAGHHCGSWPASDLGLPSEAGDYVYVVGLSRTGQHQWTRILENAGGLPCLGADDEPRTALHDVAVDSRGYVILGGAFEGELGLWIHGDSIPVAFGNANGNAKRKGFVISLKPDAVVDWKAGGTEVSWAYQFVKGEKQAVVRLGVGDGGDVAVAGNVWGGQGGQAALFVAKLADDGVLWHHHELAEHTPNDEGGTEEYSAPTAVLLDEDGNLVLVGWLRSQTSAVSLGGKHFPLEKQDVFVAKYRGTDGRYLFGKIFVFDGEQLAMAATWDVDRALVVTGTFGLDLTFRDPGDPSNLLLPQGSSTSDHNPFLVKLDLWQ